MQRSYINPFPTGDRYRVLVLGDSLGDGLWTGLYRAFEDDTNLEFVKRTRPNGGLLSGTWESDLSDALKDGTYQIAVVMYGANDDQSIKVGKDWVKVGSDAWRQAYGERIETIIKKLRAANLAIYWVGLPVMRSPTQSADAEAMNEVFREKAFINGAKYIDVVERLHGRGREVQRLRPRYDRPGEAAQGRRWRALHHARECEACQLRRERTSPRSDRRQAGAQYPARGQRRGAGQGDGP